MNVRLLKNTLIISVAVTVFVLFLLVAQNQRFGIETHLEWVGTIFLYSLCIGMVNYSFFQWLNKRLSWKTQARRIFITGILGSVILTVLVYALCKFIHLQIMGSEQSLRQFIARQELVEYIFVFLITLVVSFFMHALYFYKDIQESRLVEQQLQSDIIAAQYNVLKNQTDPHFLFNNLNVLSSLIEENPKVAQEFAADLSGVYRYVLEQKDKDLVLLQAELRFAHKYMGLLQKRYEGALICAWPEDTGNETAMIIPLSLQMALENAVKHNIISDIRPLKISVIQKNDVLIVENNLQVKETGSRTTGIGLKNINNRYKMLTGREIKIEKTDRVFRVELPVLT